MGSGSIGGLGLIMSYHITELLNGTLLLVFNLVACKDLSWREVLGDSTSCGEEIELASYLYYKVNNHQVRNSLEWEAVKSSPDSFFDDPIGSLCLWHMLLGISWVHQETVCSLQHGSNWNELPVKEQGSDKEVPGVVEPEDLVKSLFIGWHLGVGEMFGSPVDDPLGHMGQEGDLVHIHGIKT